MQAGQTEEGIAAEEDGGYEETGAMTTNAGQGGMDARSRWWVCELLAVY